MLITLTGVIGVGKSTLCEALCRELNAVPFFEPLPDGDSPNSNFMLDAYYKNPARYSFSMQCLLLALRFRAHQEAQWRSNAGVVCIEDSSYMADRCFLEVQRECGFIDELEYRAYEKLCEIHYPFLQYPDIHIHLDIPLDAEVSRICARSRECEKDIDTSYLVKLRNAYDKLIPHLAKIYPLVRIDASCSKEEVLRKALDAIHARMEQMKEEAGWPTYKKNTSYVHG